MWFEDETRGNGRVGDNPKSFDMKADPETGEVPFMIQFPIYLGFGKKPERRIVRVYSDRHPRLAQWVRDTVRVGDTVYIQGHLELKTYQQEDSADGDAYEIIRPMCYAHFIRMVQKKRGKAPATETTGGAAACNDASDEPESYEVEPVPENDWGPIAPNAHHDPEAVDVEFTVKNNT